MKHLLHILLLLLLPFASAAQTNITVGGTTRNMIVYVPSNLGSNRPLLITLHGMSQDAAYQQTNTKWNAVADTAKFVVVYPNGLNKSWDVSGTTDINFISAIIDEMYTKYGIDKSRVYLSGFSMGGMMTYHAANKLSDKIAAFAPVSGYRNTTDFTSTRAIPLIHTHGTADDVVPYAAGNSPANGVYFPGAEYMASNWAKRNNCSATPVATSPYPAGTNNTNSRKVWANGDCGTEVVLISITGKGHWHSDDPAGVYTTKEIWSFVKKYTNTCGSAAKVTLTAPANNATYTAPASITLAATATIASGSITKVEFFSGAAKLGEDASAPYSFSWANVAAGSYSVTAVATDNAGNTSASAAVSIRVNVPQAPYSGTAAAIPGKIELEHYDIGGNGSAYLDNTPGSAVTPAVNFRTGEDVDIELCTDAGTGYNIGFATAGEWLEYTVNVASAGTYDLVLRAACDGTGRTVSLSSGAAVLAADIAIPNTGGWQAWQDVAVKGIALEAGVQVLRLTIGAADYVNLNYMAFAPVSVAPAPTVALRAGWNLVGYPHAGSADIDQALASVWAHVLSVKTQDAFYDQSASPLLNTLKQLEWGKGYMVKVDAPCSISW